MSGWQVGAQVWLRRADGDSLHEAEQTCGPFVLAKSSTLVMARMGRSRFVKSSVAVVAPGALSAQRQTQPDWLLMSPCKRRCRDILRRYQEGGSPYTYTGGISPRSTRARREAELYSAATMTSYAGRLLGGNQPPHLYAAARSPTVSS